MTNKQTKDVEKILNSLEQEFNKFKRLATLLHQNYARIEHRMRMIDERIGALQTQISILQKRS